MKLSTRLGRMEASIRPVASIEIEGVDQAEAEGRFLDALLQCSPGPIRIGVTVSGTRTEWHGILRTHEEALALMERTAP